jgi:hypothetical protein
LARSAVPQGKQERLPALNQDVLLWWSKLFLGRWADRLCPVKRDCSEKRCALRALCECARKDLQAAARVEARVWLVLALCGVAVLLWAMLG